MGHYWSSGTEFQVGAGETVLGMTGRRLHGGVSELNATELDSEVAITVIFTLCVFLQFLKNRFF